MSEIVYLQNVRLSFPHLVEPHSPAPNAVKKYSADFIMAQDHAGFKQFMARVAAIAQEKWKENSPAVLQMIQADRKLRCFGGPADKVDKKTFKPYSGYDGNVYISANKDQMPQMIRLDGTPVDAGNTMEYQQLARKLYGGCFVNAAVRPWVQENQYGRGIRCDLIAIQFASDGEAFGEGAADASSLFGAVGAAPAAPAFPAFLMPQ
jgi:hypothetical protein